MQIEQTKTKKDCFVGNEDIATTNRNNGKK